MTQRESRALVDRARRGWIDRLIDRSRRNNLLYFRPLKVGTLDLTDAPARALDDLLAGEAVPLSRLVREGEDPGPHAARIRAIRRKAEENHEEKGLETLFLAVGMATWTPDDGGRPPESPVLLLPVKVRLRGRDARTAWLQRDGDPQANAVLLFELATAHGRAIDGDALLGLTAGLENGGNGGEETRVALDPEPAFAALLAGASGVPGFAVRGRVVLGNFAFQKMAMVKDLTERLDEMADHEVIAAIAGDLGAAVSLPDDAFSLDPRHFDQIHPDDEFFILDADHTQLSAIATVMTGRNMVLFGPPGTGKSQTIANLVAGLAAGGKRVLFVAEKRAALEAVFKRLEGAGVGHLALDLHGADIKRRLVINRLRLAKDTVRRAPEVPVDDLHRRFVDRRVRLNAHEARMHTPRPPSGHTVFEMQSQLLALPPDVRPATRWRGADLDRLERDAADAVASHLNELRAWADLVLEESPSPWLGAVLPEGRTAQACADVVRRVHTVILPVLVPLLDEAARAAGLPVPDTFEKTVAMAALLDEVRGTLSRYDAGMFHDELGPAAEALAPAAGGFLPMVWAYLTRGEFRAARRQFLALRSGGPVPLAALQAEASEAADQQARWNALGADGPPRAYELPETLRTALSGMAVALDALTPLLPFGDLRKLPYRELGILMERLAADTVTPFRIPGMYAVRRAIRERGAGECLDEIAARRVPPDAWVDHFRGAWMASCLDRVRAEDPALAGFRGNTHDEITEEFRRLDEERLRIAAARLRREHGERVTEVLEQHPDQAILLERELQKRSRHMPLRDLLARAPDALTALCPCWMASPLSVSQLLPADRRYFDVVVFDEASQVLPEDAVAAILRGSQVVVAGDEHQLPPTTFFADIPDEETSEDIPTSGFDSLLSVVKPYFAQGALRVHYRSRDESLIAFSNTQIYRPNGHEMLTFPGPDAEGAVSHVLVPFEPDVADADESTSAEVRRVVDLVLEHALTRPDKSLGVIAMGIRHANLVQDALDEALMGRPDLEAFFDPERPERFFVKNLERVQGDERDAIILTVGYAKDRNGILRYRFGPLNAADGSGYRRLNVAVTRARERMTVVSSFSYRDMDSAKCTAEGVRLLRAYLEYADSGARRAEEDSGESSLGGFESDLREALAARGIRCRGRYGASGQRIDLAAEHPTEPGRLVLAIEGDGDVYHRQPIARMRDRVRPQRLEALGWRFHRVWSTEWFLRRDEEAARVVAAWEAAVTGAGREETPDSPGGSVADGPMMCGGPDDGPADDPESSESREAPTALPPRPDVPVRGNIISYHPSEIDALVRWLDDTGCMTEREIMARMVTELGFSRRGSRIEEAVRASIRRVRSAPAEGAPVEVGAAMVTTSEGTHHRDVRVQTVRLNGAAHVRLDFGSGTRRDAGFADLVRRPGFRADVKLSAWRGTFPGGRSRRYSGMFTWVEPGRIARSDEPIEPPDLTA